MNAADVRRHKLSIINQPKAWVELDFEKVSDALGIEINHRMSPSIVRLTIEGRFNEMSSDDYAKIPHDVIEYLSVLNTLGKFEIQHSLLTNATKLYPFRLIKEGKNEISLSPIGTTIARFEELVDSNIGLSTYCEESCASIHFGGDKVVISCADFYPWTERQLIDIFRSFDVYAPDNTKTK